MLYLSGRVVLGLVQLRLNKLIHLFSFSVCRVVVDSALGFAAELFSLLLLSHSSTSLLTAVCSSD